MNRPIHEETLHGHTIRIIHDPDPENPRDHDNLGTMTCWHRRYRLGDRHEFNEPHDLLIDLAGVDCDSGMSMDALFDRSQKRAVILPLYLYDHSGITMNTTGFHCPWDSGQVGYIRVSLTNICDEFQIRRVTQAVRDRVANQLRQEVATYDHYLTGNCYGFVVERDGDQIDSCWGFLGDYDGTCLEEARASLV